MGEYAQAKMVSCLHGSIFNVAVDLRPGKCFGYSYSEVLSFENRKMMYIPEGFAHGYLTLEDDTLMQWCVDQDFCGEAAQAVRYDDPDLVWKGEAWPKGEYIISEKDKNAMWLGELLLDR
jgi:dTDP-4-dehydrorhamnose 3,5-epimerase